MKKLELFFMTCAGLAFIASMILDKLTLCAVVGITALLVAGGICMLTDAE